MQEEIHVDEAKDEPVVGTVLEQVEDRHRTIWESVDKQGLQLPLEVVAQNHSQAYLLIESQLGLHSVNLLLEQYETQWDNNGTQIFDDKDLCIYNP